MTSMLAVQLDFESILGLVIVIAAIAGPLIEQVRKQKKAAAGAKSAPKPVTPPAAEKGRTPAREEIIEIKLPSGQVIARVPRDRLQRGRETLMRPPPRQPASPRPEPMRPTPPPRPAPVPVARPTSVPVPAPSPPHRAPQQQPIAAPRAPRRPKRRREVTALQSHHLEKRDITTIDDTRQLGSLVRAEAEKARRRAVRRRRAAVNLRQAVIWTEIFRKPVALQNPDERFSW